MKIFFFALLISSSFAQAQFTANVSENSTLNKVVQTPSCSRETSDRYCRDRTAGSRCQGLHGVGICSINIAIPDDPYGLPACECL